MPKREKSLDNSENLPPAFDGEISNEPPVIAPENTGEPEVINELPEEIKIPEIQRPENDGNLKSEEKPPVERFYSPNGKEQFDPNLHVSKTSVTKTGFFRKKKGGFSSENQQPENEEQSTVQSGAIGATPEMVGITMSNMTLGCLSFIFGPEMMPDSKQEKQMVDGAFINFANAKQISDIPPTIALCLTLIFYAGAKIAQKETCKTRWQKFYDGAKKMVFNLYLKFKRK